jgi:hypothetical protein
MQLAQRSGMTEGLIQKPVNPHNPRHRCFGILSRKERWGLSLRGWITFVVSVAAAGTFIFFSIHRFLALTARVNSDVLVVEGWIPEAAIRESAREFTTGKYARVFTVGGPVGALGDDAADDDTYAYTAAVRLERAGLPKELIQMAPTRVQDRDRTYASAIALRRWFSNHGLAPQSFNVATMGVHSRRTLFLYKKAFGPAVQIGAISIPNPRYKPREWWRYSEGVKEVVSETAAYLYARFIFRPANI